MTKKYIIPVVALSLTALAACNTVNGAGKDLKSAGDAISNTVDKDSK